MDQYPSELKFPVEFPIKIIGINSPDFQNNMTQILLRYVTDLDMESITTRESNSGKYLSVSARFIAENRVQVDNLYRELTARPDVKWVL